MSRANCYAQTKSQAILRFGHVVIALTSACSSSKRTEPSLASLDPAEASLRITALAAEGCSGFARAIDQLAAVDGQVLIGLVDDAITAARERCPALTLTATTAAAQLVRARLAEARPAEALAFLTAAAYDRESAIRLRRAELLGQLGRNSDALRELGPIVAHDEATLAMRRLLAVGVAAREARAPELAKLIETAPVTDRASLAFRAAADAPSAALDELAREAPAELAAAIADRIERERDPAAALAARERAATAAPTIAEHWDALARAQIAAGKTADALASWDRASELAPAQAAYRLTPIRGLVIAGDIAGARKRATALAVLASAGADVELHVTASLGAAAAGDHPLAITLATEARALRPGDGRLAFELAQRHAEANQRAAAANLYAELLVCGAHGKPWHRHEVAAKLVELGDRAVVVAALDAKRSCETVDAPDLATYRDGIRGQLPK